MSAPQPSVPSRLAYVDNLRSTMIFLVVAMHAAVTYSHFGRWYYNAPEPIGQIDSLIFGMFQSHLQAFFMGLLFLLAGYFVPASFDRKGPVRFLTDRFVRLGLPTLLFVFAIHDTMGHFLLKWHGTDAFWPSYRYYIVHGDFLDGSGPMWFAAALLIFSAVYAIGRAGCRPVRAYRAPKLCTILGAGMAIGALSFLVRTVQPIGTAFHNFQFCYFAQYVTWFAFGVLAARGNWLETLPTQTGLRLLRLSAIFGPVTWLVLIISSIHYGHKGDLDGGWNLYSLASSMWEQLFAITFATGLIVWFRQRFNQTGKWSKTIADNSFAIYLFHAPVLVIVSLSLAPISAPPLVRFGTATVLAFLATLAFSHFVARRVPLLKRIL